MRKSSLWPELTEFSGAKLKELLDTPEGRALQTKLAALIKRRISSSVEEEIGVAI